MNQTSYITKFQDVLPPDAKIVVGLSGGVDSAVTAYLLKEAGFDVSAIFLQCYPLEPGCKAEEDFRDAIGVASFLNIRLEKIELIKEYRERVLNHFYNEYREGRTPNPDVLCNSEIKFRLFLDKALELSGAEYFATGHYVRKLSNVQYPISNLYRAIDESKDQSYFLYRIPQDALERSVFPLGELKKGQVRQIAEDASLPNADRPDSTGICFVGDVELVDFLRRELPEERGDVLNRQGEKVGTHRGAWFYTIGQRRGFETTLTEPVYVLKKDLEANMLVVGSYEDTFSNNVRVKELFWRADGESDTLKNAFVRIRNLGELSPVASVELESGSVSVTTREPVQAPAPGQTAVFYSQDGMVLGGGVIFA